MCIVPYFLSAVPGSGQSMNAGGIFMRLYPKGVTLILRVRVTLFGGTGSFYNFIVQKAQKGKNNEKRKKTGMA